jgi:hypothetical protein
MRRIERTLRTPVLADLRRKMAFVAGPRQVGKTTFAKGLVGRTGGYLSWDVPADRERILRGEMPPALFWALDEIHKHRPWRNLLKGLWDGRRRGQRILVTGSARLDFYRFGGDSLQGRYHLYRMHPFSVAELGLETSGELADLLSLGGFPEPFLSGSEEEARRWSREHRSRFVREDIADLERVQDLGRVELLMLRLPELVGSPLSINALREDLQVSHKSVDLWIRILERLYGIFRIAPFGAARIRAVKKEQKHYHFDWSLVPGPGPRFENLVASHLLKWVQLQEDAHGRDLELRYFRDVDGREVDFVVTEAGRPIRFVEAKAGDDEVARGLRYLHERFPRVDAWQISLAGTKDYVTRDGIRVAPALELLSTLA